VFGGAVVTTPDVVVAACVVVSTVVGAVEINSAANSDAPIRISIFRRRLVEILIIFSVV